MVIYIVYIATKRTWVSLRVLIPGATPSARFTLESGLICQVQCPSWTLVRVNHERTRINRRPITTYGPIVNPHESETSDQNLLFLANIRYPWKITKKSVMVYALKILRNALQHNPYIARNG